MRGWTVKLRRDACVKQTSGSNEDVALCFKSLLFDLFGCHKNRGVVFSKRLNTHKTNILRSLYCIIIPYRMCGTYVRPHWRHVDPPSQQFDKRVSKFVQNINVRWCAQFGGYERSLLQSGARPMLGT